MRSVLPMKSWLLRPAQVEIRIGEPIDTAGMTLHDRGRLSEMLHDRVAGLVGEAAVATHV
jgi:hypothetical protein